MKSCNMPLHWSSVLLFRNIKCFGCQICFRFKWAAPPRSLIYNYDKALRSNTFIRGPMCRIPVNFPSDTPHFVNKLFKCVIRGFHQMCVRIGNFQVKLYLCLKHHYNFNMSVCQMDVKWTWEIKSAEHSSSDRAGRIRRLTLM